MLTLCSIAGSTKVATSSANTNEQDRESNKQQDEAAQSARPPSTLIGQPATATETQSGDEQSHEWPDTQLLAWIGRAADRIARWLLRPSPSGWLLVFVGTGGVWAALRTLRTIERQTEANILEANAANSAAVAAQLNTDVLIRLNRPYVTIENWSATPRGEQTLWIRFDIINTGDATVQIELVKGVVGSRASRPFDITVKRLLTPHESYRFTTVGDEPDHPFVDCSTNFCVDGTIVYTDIFNKRLIDAHRRRFSKCFVYANEKWGDSLIETPGGNTEHDWGKDTNQS